ncbi:M20 family metallopeptidase [Paenibacillus beijingensis]|uniref:Peptidase M20 n=1 Tax=Paenibacillus beijingensis TaxID=1126833 RepID=A0A0D5NRF8_9BACL|nr:M20 family metallopeptidase [Paenibacillus beijingensis]AJY77871.1 peptidase M20 [Paenibacillus beijingensis]
MNETKPFMQRLTELYPEMVQNRRYLHRHPELSFQEKETSAWIADRLRPLGCELKEGVGGYGVVAEFKGVGSGPVIALRADIDALPIQDGKECEYRSTVSGKMHACGHDGHTATLLGIASYYASLQGAFKGTRRLLFQPAEELTPGGALPMIKDGALESVDAIYGVHLWTPIPYGEIHTRPGPFMAAVDEFAVEITGKGGHGGMPEATIDAIATGAALVQSLQTIVSRNVSPLDTAVLSIGSFQAGTTSNVIAEKCLLKGTVRTFDENVRGKIRTRLADMVNLVCAGYGASAVLDYRDGYPAVVNDETETERFFRIGKELFGEVAVQLSKPITAGEDFAYYLHHVKGCFMFVGAGSEQSGAVYPHHHPRFDIDERSMLKSAQLMVGMAEDYAREFSLA